MPRPRLYYFNSYGRAEVIRQILAVAEVDYEDFRFRDWDDWLTHKPDMPFGQVPVLEMDGLRLCGSIVICKYLARKYGLSGESLLEDAQADMLAYTVYDFRKPFKGIIKEKDPEIKEELRHRYATEQLPAWLTQFETYLKGNGGGEGYFVGQKMTWVDIYFTCNMNPLSYKTKCDMDLDLTPYPKLQALVERVNAHPRIADWLRVRPQTKS